MCLIVFAWQTHPDYQLILAANRDEFHGRPSRELAFWPELPEVLAGRDLEAGGTWLAAHRQGRFATVTNYRDPATAHPARKTRGELVTNFVTGDESAGSFATSIDGADYAGFSLLTSDGNELFYVSNRGDPPNRLEPGVYGLSNASLNTPWPKLLRSREALSSLVDTNSVNSSTLFRLMADRNCATGTETDTGGLPFDLARALTAPFIVTPDYGTRCSTTLLWSHRGKIELSERRFDASGNRTGESCFSFAVENS